MGRVIWMVQNPIFFFCVVFFPFIIGFLVTIPIPPRVSSVVISTLTLSYITAMLYLLMRRKPVIRVLFTEDGLVVHRGAGGFAVPRYVVVATFTEDGLVIGRGGRRGGVFIPKSVVVTGNVVCIRRANEICIVGCIRMGPKPILDVTYESLIYAIPLSQRQYDRLVNALATHWGWIPPECPEQLIQAR